MKNLFYCSQTQTVFWIAGYTEDLGSYNVDVICKALKKLKTQFLSLFKIEFNNVFTQEITKSNRYARMRVFWAGDISPQDCPQDAFDIGKNFTMETWLKT